MDKIAGYTPLSGEKGIIILDDPYEYVADAMRPDSQAQHVSKTGGDAQQLSSAADYVISLNSRVDEVVQCLWEASAVAHRFETSVGLLQEMPVADHTWFSYGLMMQSPLIAEYVNREVVDEFLAFLTTLDRDIKWESVLQELREGNMRICKVDASHPEAQFYCNLIGTYLVHCDFLPSIEHIMKLGWLASKDASRPNARYHCSSRRRNIGCSLLFVVWYMSIYKTQMKANIFANMAGPERSGRLVNQDGKRRVLGRYSLLFAVQKMVIQCLNFPHVFYDVYKVFEFMELRNIDLDSPLLQMRTGGSASAVEAVKEAWVALVGSLHLRWA